MPERALKTAKIIQNKVSVRESVVKEPKWDMMTNHNMAFRMRFWNR